MKLIYKNEYGASYKVDNHSNPDCTLQMVIGTVGLFMTENEITNLLSLIRKSNELCYCENCGGERCNKIWTTNILIDTCIKVDDSISELLEDLILGTQFILNMDTTLDKYRIK